MTDKWFLRPSPNRQARLRLFCCHPAGRGASTFVPWANLLPKEIELCCIQLPGRESRMRETPFNRLPPLLDNLEESIFPLLDRPFALFGASMGAIVAFELARRLRQTYSILPVHLFLASRRAPQTPERLPLIAHLPDAPFLQEVQSRYNSIPEIIRSDKDLMEMFIPLLRADFLLIETYPYTPEAPLDCPLTALHGATDSIVLADEMAAWQVHTARSFRQITYQGGHFFFNEQPARVVEDLITEIKRG